MNKAGQVILLVAICYFSLAEAFNFDRDVLSHFRSKRQLKRVCAAELYNAPLTTICKVPPYIALAPEITKCLASLKMKSVAEGDPVCIYDCVYQAKKWVSATGVLDLKKFEPDFNKGVGAAWAPTVTASIKKNAPEIAKRMTAKLSSGYVTKCKTGAYMLQTATVVDLYANCPASLRSTSFAAGKTALMACDPYALTKTAAELASGATNALKGIDAKSLAGADPKALLAKMPAGMAALIPKGLDVSKLDTKALLANPSALAGKLPAGVNMASLASMFGKRR